MRTTRKQAEDYAAMKLKLWLKLHKINKAGKAPISLRITINGKRAEYSTDFRVRPDEWDQVNECILGDTRAAAKNNDTLEEIKADARQAKKELPLPDRTAANVAKAMRGTAPAPTVCLLTKLESVLASHYRHANQDTRANFERAAVLLQQWHGKPTLDLQAFTMEKKQAFVGWLLTQMTPAGVRTYLTALVAMWNRAAVFPADVKPFGGVKIPKHQPKEKASLSEDQVHTLATGGPLPAQQHDARNLYLACLYLHGSRISAVLMIRWQDVDSKRVRYQAMKGGPLKKVKIRPELQAILAQYRPEAPNPAAFVFPYLPADFFHLPPLERYKARKRAVSKVGWHLAGACATLGLPDNIHPHTARHTMARITVEANDGDIRATQHVIGHTSYQQTEEYVRDMVTHEIDAAAERAYDQLAGLSSGLPAAVRAVLNDPVQLSILLQQLKQSPPAL
jgi:integrase/recombinase XerD